MALATLTMLDKLLLALMALLAVGYVGINFMLDDAPKFLVVENLVLAAVYAILAYAIATGKPWGYPVTVFAAAFNAGRVSRSVVTPEGTLAELAVEHVPLLLVILLVALLALVRLLES